MALALPPYGHMVGYFEDGAAKPLRPSQWKVDVPSWESWMAGVVALLREDVWPTWRDGAWDSTPAAANAMELTRADLAAIRDFRARYRLAFVGATGLYHADLMIMEDTAEGWITSMRACCPELADAPYNFEKAREHCIFNFLGEFTPQAFKKPFQRPRPFQAAFLLDGAREFRRDEAVSADTPALISGHALQGLMVGCTIFESIRGDGPLAARTRERLQAWMTGVGDRRVMAGVHYPTDSLASWIVAAELVDKVFAQPAVRAFLVEAIRGSLLYRFLETRVGSTAAYGRPWKCLQEALARAS